MIPVVTAAEMQAVDAGAGEPVEVLVGRAGAAVAAAAQRLLGGAYGKRVTVVAGKGNNGADGRSAAGRLRQRGAAVEVIDAASVAPGAALPRADLVIDAAYGTGFRGAYHPPDAGGAPVLAVDIPSGLPADTGVPAAEGAAAGGSDRAGASRTGGGPGAGRAPEATGAVHADLTVTFAALKPGLLLGEGPQRVGRLVVADIGLGAGVERVCTTWLVEDADVAAFLPDRARDAHKWQSAVQVIAGSPGMTGAPWLVSRGALRAGAGYVRLGMPGVALPSSRLPPGELVADELPATDWDRPVLEGLGRVRALVLGPGLGQADGVSSSVTRLLREAAVPTVLDADGLNALGSLQELAELVRAQDRPVVVTPHDGEYRRLVGSPPGPDRLADVRAVAARTGATVLLKGSTTIVAEPGGRALLVTAGSSRLATAGTGDVLSGVIGAFLARGLSALEAAALAAHVHGRAAALGFAQGLVASDLPQLVATWLSEHLQ